MIDYMQELEIQLKITSKYVSYKLTNAYWIGSGVFS